MRKLLYFLLGFTLAICAGVSYDARATATQTYLMTWTYAPGGTGCSFNSQMSLAAAEDQAVTATNCAYSPSQQGLCDLSGWSTSNSGTTYGQTYKHGTPNCVNGPSGMTIDGSCPDGGTIGGTDNQYPGWCVINGQPPPNPASKSACQAASDFSKTLGTGNNKGIFTVNENDSATVQPTSGSSMYDPGVLGTFQSGGVNYNDTGCSLSIGAVSFNANGTWTALATLDGTVSTNQLNSDSPLAAIPPSGPPCASGDTDTCLAANAPMAPANVPDPEQQATIAGTPVDLPTSIPNDSCVSVGSGGLVCSAGALQPDNGANPPTQATPTDVITVQGSSGPQNFNYYNNGTVGNSSNYGNKSTSTSGTSTTTTCDQNGANCTTAKTTTTATSAASYGNYAFPAGTSANSAIASAANAIQNSPLVVAASGAIAQNVPAGTCPNWTVTLQYTHTTLNFSEICTLAQNNKTTIVAVFDTIWVILGAIIILTA